MPGEPQLPDESLDEAVDQLARDIIEDSLFKLMPRFTAGALPGALALRAGPDTAKGADDYEIADLGDRNFRITFRGQDDDGAPEEGAIDTHWTPAGDKWKVDKIGRAD